MEVGLETKGTVGLAGWLGARLVGELVMAMLVSHPALHMLHMFVQKNDPDCVPTAPSSGHIHHGVIGVGSPTKELAVV